jgi:ATP-binding cassette, subfamily C (CFTR/MRP), member 1
LLEKNIELVDRSQKPYYLMLMIQKWLALVIDLIIAALAVLVVGIAVKMRASISPGFAGVSLTQIISFTGYLKMLLLFWAQMETSIGAIVRVKAFQHETEIECVPETEMEVSTSWPNCGQVAITGLNASYE